MTRNQADLKHDTVPQGSRPAAFPTTPTRIPARYLENEDDDDLPPYSETDPSGPASNLSIPQRHPPPPPLEKGKLPDLEPINTTEAIALQGPFRIHGSIKTASQASLQHNIHVDGNVNASTNISLRHDVFVNGDVQCGRTVFLSDGARVAGKVTGGYGIEMSTKNTGALHGLGALNSQSEVSVGGDVESRVSTFLHGGDAGVRVAGSVSQRGGSMKIEGDVQIARGIDVHGGVLLRGFENRGVVIGGKTSMNGVMSTEGDVTIENLVLVGILNIEGRLHVKGNLEAKGCVYLKKGSRLLVDGKKRIKGVFKEVTDFTFKH